MYYVSQVQAEIGLAPRGTIKRELSSEDPTNASLSD